MLKAVNFETGSATLNPSSYAMLDSAAALFKQDKELRYEIQGHADNVGTVETNRLLSAARAGTVKNYIVSKGVPERNVIATGYGSEKPIADNSTAAGRANNRRVEIVLIESQEKYDALRAAEAAQRADVQQANIRGAQQAAVEPEPEPEPVVEPEPEPEPEPEVVAEPEPEPEPEPGPEPEAVAEPEPEPEPADDKKCAFLFSIRPELVWGVKSSADSKGGNIGIGFVRNSLFFEVDLGGGDEYFGGDLNLGYILHGSGRMKNVIGLNGGYWERKSMVEVERDGETLGERGEYTKNYGGIFWKLLYGKRHNLDITNKFLFGNRKEYTATASGNEQGWSWEGRDNNFSVTYSLSIGYTFINVKN